MQEKNMVGKINMGALPFPRNDLAPIIGHKKRMPLSVKHTIVNIIFCLMRNDIYYIFYHFIAVIMFCFKVFYKIT